MYPLINSVRMLLYFQMFSDCKETSYKTDSHSQKNSYWQKCSIYFCDRKEINDILKKMEPLKNIVNCLLIYQVQNSKWNHSSDCSDEQSLKHERCSDKSILRSDIFHNSYLFSSDSNTHGNCITDQENRYR